MRKKLRKLLFVIIVTCIALAYVFHLDHYLTLESIKANRVLLKSFVDRHYIPSVLLYCFGYFLLIALSLPTGGILTLLGGFLFGTLPATLYVIISATTGACISFLTTRFFVGDSIEKQYPRYAQRINREVSRYGYSYLLVLRLVTIVPFFLVNILAGTTSVSFLTFLWTTAVGIIPATMIIAFAGQQLGTINSFSDIFSKNLIIAFALLGILALLPMLYHRFFRKRVL
jgi:uncharacterized membrane protein YdjX (TVP38/TMEM64 family)